MALYTVKYFMQRLISKFDTRGKKISDVSVMVEHTQHDLPYSTALMYQNTDAHGTCEIIKQAASYSDSKGHRRQDHVGFGDYVRKPSSKTISSKASENWAKNAKNKTKGEKRTNAAATGDMSAAINQAA
ncbi:MAG: hypothetical protein ACEQSB_00535 [Undibacterium sp.]